MRRHGVKGSLRLIAEQLYEPIARRIDRYLDRRFDRKHHVDTAGVVPFPESVANDPAYRQAEPYEQSPARTLNRMIDSLRIDCSRFAFVDFGCGKGKAVLVAAMRPFKRVIGVELSPELLRVAENNLTTWQPPASQCCPVELHCADATQFPFPEDNLVLFLAHPFKEPAWITVIERLRRTLIERPREIYVLYVDARNEDLLRRSGYLRPVWRGYKSCIYSAIAPGDSTAPR